MITVIVFFAAFEFCRNNHLEQMYQYLGTVPNIIENRKNELQMRSRIYEEDVLARAELGLKLYTEKEFAVVKVSDTGCGISPEVGAHIFEKFYQGDTSHATQGNGLGLALVKRIVDLSGGKVFVENLYEGGVCFVVELPFVIGDMMN